MKKELVLLGVAILVFSLVGCTSSQSGVNEEEVAVSELEIELSDDGFDSAPDAVVPEDANKPLSASAASLGISEEDLAISDLEIYISEDGFQTDLEI